ncbi:MAG: hypothetical protein ACQES2_07845 [Pseudomonadota bacterium]
MARNYIDEINSKRTRKPEDGDSIWEFILRLENTRNAVNDLKEKSFKCCKSVELEFMRMLPLVAVSAFEGYLSSVYGLIIDKGEPYVSNIQKIRDVKLDIASLVSMQRDNISLGDFMSHCLNFGKLTDIDKNFSTLLGIDFLKSLSELGKDQKSNIVKCIEIRNVIAHELATGYQYTNNYHYELFHSIVVFVFEVENLIYNQVGLLKKHDREIRS